METKKIRLIVGAWLLSILLVVTLFLLFRKIASSDNDLMASEIVAVNIQSSSSLAQTMDSKKIDFFTGTSLASLNTNPLDQRFLTTTGQGKDVPLAATSKVRRKGSALLIQTEYDKNNILLDKALGAASKFASGQVWLVLDKDRLQPAPFSNHTQVIDAGFSQAGFFALERSPNQQALYSYDSSGSKQLLASNLPATSIVATTGDKVVLQDYGGGVFLWDGTTYKQITPKASEVFFDANTRSVIYTPLEEQNIGEEGGLIEHDHEDKKSSSLHILNLDSLSDKKFEPKFSNTYVSNGYIVSTPSIARPTELELYTIKEGSSSTQPINQDLTKVSNQIQSLVITPLKPLTIFAITNNNMVTIWGNEDTLAKAPSYSFPHVPAQQDEYIYDYSIGRNQVTITGVEDPNTFVQKSLTALQNACDCDTNQIQKNWILIQED